jgi:hypothetical protein
MRTFLLHAAAWASALQTVGSSPANTSDPARLIGVAGVLGSVTVFVYRLGVWRQDMENTRTNMGAELKAFREESAGNFARMERRLDRLEGGPRESP